MIPHETTGVPAPITRALYADGTVRITLESVNAGHGTYGIVPKAEREADPKPRPHNHWSNCPRRAESRRNRQPGRVSRRRGIDAPC